jgi:radial spoke head protein 9
MDAHALITLAPHAATGGFFLSTEERVAVSSSVPTLASAGHYASVKLLGKITGVERDYLVCIGYAASNAAAPSAAWFSFNGMDWSLLPPLSATERSLAKKISGPLLGKPDFQFILPDPNPPAPKVAAVPAEGEEEAAPAEEEASAAPTVTILELQRLTAIVDDLISECSVVPRGAYVLNSLQEVVPNKLFVGLSGEDAGKLTSYLKASKLGQLDATLLEKEHLSKSLDFAPSVADDVPRGSWSLSRDVLTGVVLLRSLLWPGFVTFSVPESSVFGSFYCGNGCKNTDIGFML